VPLVATQSSQNSADAEPGVVEAEPVLEQEQLGYGDQQVGELDDQVRHGQVVAVPLAADQAAVARQRDQLTTAAVVGALPL